MLRKIFLLSVIATLASCQHKPAHIEQVSNVNETDSYQTMNSEAEADRMNEMAQAKIDEQVEEIEVKDRVFFDYDSAKLSKDAKEILAVQAEWLKSDKSIKITIEGHCDERGTREYNIALGEKRANTAKNYLIKKGVAKSRIKTVSYGKEKPAFFGSTPKIMAKNRRAVTVIN